MATVLLSIQLNLAPLVGGLITFAVYVTDRIADADDDELDKPQRVAFVRRHKQLLTVLGALAYGFAVTLSVFGGPLAFGVTMLPGAAWVLYASDFLPSIHSGMGRLKDSVVINSGLVAFAWAVTLTFLPVAFADMGPFNPAVGIIFVYFFFRSYLDAELPNIRDVESDKAAGVSTLPVKYGVGWTRRAMYGIDLLTVGIIAIAVFGDLVPALGGLALLAGVAFSIVVSSRIDEFDENGWVSIAPDMEYVLSGGLLILIWFFR
ncbi:UbiA family prenyltransferase [Halodesulfurarchaeum formicicum]|nr:UbiA family prenyltransferase [Halodesulfurarchaeum formicicum]